MVLTHMKVLRMKQNCYDSISRTYTVPAQYTVIGAHAFENRPDIKRVVFQGDVLTIRRRAFKGCKNLKYVNLKPGIEIQSEAFAECGFEELSLPVNYSAEPMAFANCRSLEYLEFDLLKHQSVISENEFYCSCGNLKSIKFHTDRNSLYLFSNIFKHAAETFSIFSMWEHGDARSIDESILLGLANADRSFIGQDSEIEMIFRDGSLMDMRITDDEWD